MSGSCGEIDWNSARSEAETQVKEIWRQRWEGTEQRGCSGGIEMKGESQGILYSYKQLGIIVD